MSHDDLNVKIESTEVDIFVDRTTDVEVTVDILPDVMVSVPPDELNILVDAKEIDIRIDNQPPDIELTLTSLPDVIVLPTTGLTGPMGPKGLTGETGPRGLTGPEGAQGIKGDTGSQGSQGPIGAAGPQGQTGPQGAASTVPGPVGPVGPMGTVYDSDQIGTIKAWSCPVIPENWALGLGQTVNRVDYPDYADELGIPAGQATFQFPNLSDRFLYGATTTAEIGQTGGEAVTTLAVGHMPRHAHTVSSHSHGGATGGSTTGWISADHTHGVGMDNPSANHIHSIGANYIVRHEGGGVAYNAVTGLASDGGGNQPNVPTGTVSAWHTHNAWTGGVSANHNHSVPALSITAEAPGTDYKGGTGAQTPGDGTPHNNMPPWIKVGWIVKVKGAQIDTAGNLVGATGAQGPQGIKGDTGNTGATGATGPQGETGLAGGTAAAMRIYQCAQAPNSAGAWAKMKMSGAVQSFIEPSNKFTINADDSVTVTDAGWYDCAVSIMNFADTNAQWLMCSISRSATPADGDIANGGSNSIYARASCSGHIYLSAGDKVYVHAAAQLASTGLRIYEFSISRMGTGATGPAGPQGAPGGPANQVPTTYSVTAGYTVDRAFNPEITSLTEVARVLGSLIADMKTAGLIAP